MDFKLVTLLLCFVVGVLSENEQYCITPDGEEAKCVDLDSCIILQDFIKNPVGEVNEYLNKSRCDEENGIKICCPSSLNATVFNTEVLKNETKIQLLDRTNCGYKNEEVMSIYQLSWLGQIMAFGWPLCSCSLINARYVLTSASCASDNLLGSAEQTGVVIMLGDLNQETTNKNCSEMIGRTYDDCIFFETFGAEYYVAHPFYNPMKHYASHDIGLIRLNRTVVYKDYIRPICLPPFKTPDLKLDDILYTAGWALYPDKETGRNSIKHKVESNLLTREQCAQMLNICDSTDIRIKISPTTMCQAQDITTASVLLGETGSPVMNPYDNQWYLEGILSHRRETCWGPLVWTRIESYITWIEGNMQPWT